MAAISLQKNRDTWIDEAHLQSDPWRPRAQRACSFVVPGERVLDLGCGLQLTRPFLEPASTYVPCDISARTPDTIVCDFSKEEFPEGQFDTTLILGVLEFVPNIDFIFERLRDQTKKVIFSYCICLNPTPLMISTRTSYRFLTHWTATEMDALVRRHGFKFVHIEELSTNPAYKQILGILSNTEKC